MVGSPGIISRHSIIIPGTQFLSLENLTGVAVGQL